jgi:hypothetical protein
MLRRINFGQSNFVSTITLAAALNADLRRNCGGEKERKKEKGKDVFSMSPLRSKI